MKTKNLLIIMIILAILFMLQIIAMPRVYGLKINEIMFNPEGADSGREWIEIILNESDGCVNLTTYKLYEEGTNHNIYSDGSDMVCKYAILSNNLNAVYSDYPYLNNTENLDNITVYKSTFSLSNTGEDIGVKKDSVLIDYMNYSMILQVVTVMEGYSLEYRDDAWRESAEISGTPGNIFLDIIDNQTGTNQTHNQTINNQTSDNQTNTNQTRNNQTSNNQTTEYNNTGDMNNTVNNTINNTINITTNTTTNMTVNSTINTTNNITTNYTINNTLNTSCLLSIKIYLKEEHEIYNNSNAIKFQNKLELMNKSEKISDKVSNYTIEYWIEDYFGNNIKSKISTTNQDEKTYTPKIDESDKILIIKSIIKEINFKDTKCKVNASEDEKIILIVYGMYKKPECAVCTTTKSKSSSSSTTSTATKTAQCISNEATVPIMRTVNVCNYSEKSLSNAVDKKYIQNSTESQMILLSSDSVKISNTSISASQSETGKITNMIVYESPNLKNRAYALIGLIIVCLASTIFIIYKWRINSAKQS